MDGTTEAIEWAHTLSVAVHRLTRRWAKGDGADIALDLRRSVRWIPVDLLDAEALSRSASYGTSSAALDALSVAACSLGRAQYLLRLATDLSYSRPADSSPLSVNVEELAAYIARWRAELEERLERIEAPALN